MKDVASEVQSPWNSSRGSAFFCLYFECCQPNKFGLWTLITVIFIAYACLSFSLRYTLIKMGTWKVSEGPFNIELHCHLIIFMFTWLVASVGNTGIVLLMRSHSVPCCWRSSKCTAYVSGSKEMCVACTLYWAARKGLTPSREYSLHLEQQTLSCICGKVWVLNCMCVMVPPTLERKVCHRYRCITVMWWMLLTCSHLDILVVQLLKKKKSGLTMTIGKNATCWYLHLLVFTPVGIW